MIRKTRKLKLLLFLIVNVLTISNYITVVRLVRSKGIYVVVLTVFVIKILEDVKEWNHLTIKDSQGIMGRGNVRRLYV